ncbi:MAG TPA: hypothetical protein VHY79_05705 [Rhizomicrobium sp.]|jgi:hypothetical protein|nr:hypothetical protein [Rhizomicrobium sp.]
MNNITKTLLGGAALCALATAPAIAGNIPAFHVQALHAGHAVNKTKIYQPGRTHLTYTFSVGTYVPASDLGTAVNLIYTYYKWNSSDNLCTQPKMKIKAPKKTQYAKLGHSTETYSEGCGSPTVFYGDTYDLTNSKGEGNQDSFQSDLIGKFKNGSTKYLGNLYLDVTVSIGR